MGINLDEARAARREAQKEIPEPIVFNGVEFELPLELPITCVHWMTKLGVASEKKDGEGITKALVGTVEALFSAETCERFMAFNPSLEDLLAVVEGLPEEYGLTAGESTASAEPSKTTTSRSRPASKPSTKSTPPKPSGGQKQSEPAA